jgi:hypothetical protein
MSGNIFNVPHVISSETVEGLRALMLENNQQYKSEFVYYQIVHDGRRFHAFYMKQSDDLILLQKKKQKQK